MNIYTNKFPLSKAQLIVDYQSSKIEGLDETKLIPIGTAFKVVAVDVVSGMSGVILRNSKHELIIHTDVFKLAFVESEVEV
jgi:hypothetical protein